MKKCMIIMAACLAQAMAHTAAHAQTVMINEYSCANLSQVADNYTKYEDWIEIHNPTTAPINMGGYYLSDDTTQLTKWQMPATLTIAAGGYKIFWASGRGTNAGINYHTNFKLSQTKATAERICLSNAAGVLIDKIKINKTQVGHSRGRTTNAAATWSIFALPTPNASNNNQTAYTNYTNRPSFDATPGFYNTLVTVSITNNEPTAVVRYTTNGNEPTATSTLYTTPLTLTATTALKAKAFTTNTTTLTGFVEYATYFVNVNHTLPIISLAGTSLQTLANGSQSLRPIGSLEYFDTLGVRKARAYGEYNSHGQDSWANDQRSLDFIARDEMGYTAYIKEKLFALTDRDKFQRIILRAAGDDNYPAANRASNAGSAHVRDAYIQNIAKTSNMKLDVRTAAKCIIYLNGTYWGVYDIRELPDDHDYTDYNYNQGKYNLQYILTWGNTWAEYGGTQAISDWNALYNYAMTNDLTIPAHYKYVVSRLDAESLVDYVILNSVTVCSDWLNYNTGWWRGTNPQGTHQRWGYILWDNDATFDFYINYTGIPSTAFNAPVCQAEGLTSTNSDPEGHIALMNKLRTNPDFNQYYKSRYIDLMNTAFSCENMLHHLDSTIALLQPEMEQHATRWNGTYNGWWNNAQVLRTYIFNRCNAIPATINACYGLTGPYRMYFDVDSANALHRMNINSLTIDKFPYEGSYYNGINIKLLAYTNDTLYKFKKWDTNQLSLLPYDSIANVNLLALQTDTITAKFVRKPIIPNVANNEIDADKMWLQAQPNPFNTQTTLSYYLPKPMRISLKIYNTLGTQVMQLSSKEHTQQTGQYDLSVNFAQNYLPAGIYFAQLTTPSGTQTVKLIYTQ